MAAALLGFAGSSTPSKGEHTPTDNLVAIIAMILLPVAVLMVAYAMLVFVWRSKAIAKKQVGSESLSACMAMQYRGSAVSADSSILSCDHAVLPKWLCLPRHLFLSLVYGADNMRLAGGLHRRPVRAARPCGRRGPRALGHFPRLPRGLHPILAVCIEYP